MIGETLAGIAGLIFCCFVAYLIYTIGNAIEQNNKKETAYFEVEESALQNVSEKLGINVREFQAKNRALNTPTFRKALEDKMVEEYLLKENEKKKETKKQKNI